MAHGNSWDEREVQRTRELIQDGRLIEVSDNYITQLKNCSELTNQGGGFGQIYISRDPVPGFKHRLVLKEICVSDENSKSQTQLLGSVKNEKLASRVRHFGIVPVVAFHDDISNGKYYLISPYFENGDLYLAIGSDREKLHKDEKVLLDWKTRLKAIYQIACAIDYMHKPNSFRGIILHLDIKSPNIVLDKGLNARLIDFGLSRESMTGSYFSTATIHGTQLYQPEDRTLRPQSDYYAFGVVMRELLTGLDPAWTDNDHRTLKQIDIRTLSCLLERRIWNVSDVLDKVCKIARKCIESGETSISRQHDSMTSTSMLKALKSILEQESTQKWTILGDNHCEICVVNDQLEEPLKNETTYRRIYDINHDNCATKIKICCACMRNSYINPVRCQECDNEIKAIIGDGWGAIVIAGYDKKNQALFQNDVKKFAEAISSKVLPSMCVSTIIPIDSGTNETKTVSKRLDDAFDSIGRQNINTLVFLYSGHHGHRGFLVGNNQYIGIDKINDGIKKCTKLNKIIAFMDCCQPEQISVSAKQCLIQFNATNSKKSAFSKSNIESLFTKLLVQAFTMKASGGQCTVAGCNCSIDGYFITIDSLWKYIDDHRRKGALLKMEPEQFLKPRNWQNEYLSYNYTFKVEFRFDIVLPQPFNEKKTCTVLPTDLSDFKDLIPEKLFPEFVSLLGTHLKAKPKAITRTLACADCLCIVYDKDPKRFEEIDNMEKLLLAWNSMRLLYCKLRDFIMRDLRKPAGFFVQNGKRVEECMPDLHYGKNTYNSTEFKMLLDNLTKREQEVSKEKKNKVTEKALKTFIDTVYKLRIPDELQVNNRILKIQFLDLFEEDSDCVVYLLLIDPAVPSSTNDLGDNSAQGDSTINQRMETDQVREPPARTLQHTVQNSLDDLNRSRTVTVMKTITKDLHDGRLIELDKNTIEYLMTVSSTDDTLVGGFGRVFKSKEPVKGFGIRVVLKEIDMERRTGNESLSQTLGSVTNAKIASRLMHFAIVPVLAYHDDFENRKFYLLSPYLANGDLFQAIESDRKNMKNLGNDIRLRWQIRMKIMYHIACAIDYMHTGNEFRGPVLHMDIRSKNIVLDSQYNARLIDFGIARELKADAETLVTSTNYETPEYFFPLEIVVKKQHDYYNFGVVLLELITGLEPSAIERMQLRNGPVTLIDESQQVMVWNANTIVKKVAEIAVKCIASVTADNSIKTEEIKNNLKTICRRHSAPEWETKEGDTLCEICLVNEDMKVGFDGHDTNLPVQAECMRRIRICCSCMRNSYINPVKCHTCGETIQPFINAKWGAILIAGYDEKAGEVLQDNIKKFKEVITSKVLPAMCINPQNVIILVENMDDIKADEKLDKAFDDLSEKEIQTLLFVYSGHHDEISGFQLSPNVYYHLDKVTKRLNKWKEEKPHFGKVVAFLDCCYPQQLNLNNSLKLIQFNASSADLDKQMGSPFLMYVMQAFTARANGKVCRHEGCKCYTHIVGNFITVHDLWEYLNEHVKIGQLEFNTPYMNAANIDLKDTILAYNYDFEVKFEFTLQWLDLAPWKLYVLPMDFIDFKHLKLIIAKDILRHVYGINQEYCYVLSKFAEIISLEINTGPSTTHVQEIDKVELLLLAWNSKRQLRCLVRLLSNVNVDKPVGRCLKNVPDILAVHQDILQEYNITEHQLTLLNLRQYKKLLEKKIKAARQYTEYMFVVDMLIHYTTTQLQNARLEISFFDLATDLKLVHVNLVQTYDDQEVAMQ